MKLKRLQVKARRLWRKRGSAPALLCSFVLHGAVLALLLLWPSAPVLAPPPMIALIIDLVESPASGKDAAQSADAPTAAASEPAPTQRTETPPVSPTAKGDAAPAAQQAAAPTLGDLLRGAEAAHRGPSSPASGSGGVGVMDTEDMGGTGTISLKDFLRVRIERRWQIDPSAPNVLVSVRLMIAADGSVMSAEPVNDGGPDKVMHALAISARNAALLASPLQFPRGTFAITGEMIIDLSTREARR